MPGEFHAAEAAHLVAASDLNGDQILTKEEVVESPKYRYLRHIAFNIHFFTRLRMLTRFSWAHKPRIMGKALFCMKNFDH